MRKNMEKLRHVRDVLSDFKRRIESDGAIEDGEFDELIEVLDCAIEETQEVINSAELAGVEGIYELYMKLVGQYEEGNG